MKINSASFFTLVTALAITVLMMPALSLAAGHIAPVGVTTRGASQLIVWYDETGSENVGFEGLSTFQITNSSTDTAVNIHVQIFADFDTSEGGDAELCREHDFNDTLTLMDTVMYRLSAINETDDDPGPPVAPFTSGNNSGLPIPIDLDGTRGFIVVTSVDTVTLPRQAISHNFLFGSIVTYYDNSTDSKAHSLEAMGREAVDVATGGLAPPGTLLDGANNALRILQPSTLYLSFDTESIEFDTEEGDQESANVVSISFEDVYSDPSGEYRATPSTVAWDPVGFDQFEVGTSCRHHDNTCFITMGINRNWDSEIDDNTGSSMGVDDFTDGSEDRLCPSQQIEGQEEDTAFIRIRVSGLSGLENHIGALALDGGENTTSAALASWMAAE